MHNRMMRGGAAPILVDGEVKGAAVVAYDFTAAGARDEAELVHTDVVYFMDKVIRASSYRRGDAEDSETVKQVSAALMGSGGPVQAALEAGKPSEVLELEVNGEEQLVVTGPLPEAVTIVGVDVVTKVTGEGKRVETIVATSKHTVGFAVLVNLDERMASVSTARYLTFVFGLLILLMVALAMWTVARHFVNAEDSLELGVSEIINGNLDYTFDTLQEFEGLANALNVMLARLLGRPEPGEDEEGDTSWRPDVLTIEELVPGGADTDVQALAAEDEQAYYTRVHQEYVQARQAAGLSVEGITADDFQRKLQANAAMLCAKHKCNLIRFQVHSAAGRVGLKPIRLG
jgi:hypothetical protein